MTESITQQHVFNALKLGIAAVQRGDFASALPVFTALYQSVPFEKAPEGLSYYGLAVARIEHKNKRAIELCRLAINMHPGDGRHYANLIRLYMYLKSEKYAIETLEEGLKLMPKDEILLAMREEIGYKKQTTAAWVPSKGPLNKVYTVLEKKLSGKGFVRYVYFFLSVAILVGFYSLIFFFILE